MSRGNLFGLRSPSMVALALIVAPLTSCAESGDGTPAANSDPGCTSDSPQGAPSPSDAVEGLLQAVVDGRQNACEYVTDGRVVTDQAVQEIQAQVSAEDLPGLRYHVEDDFADANVVFVLDSEDVIRRFSTVRNRDTDRWTVSIGELARERADARDDG